MGYYVHYVILRFGLFMSGLNKSISDKLERSIELFVRSLKKLIT